MTKPGILHRRISDTAVKALARDTIIWDTEVTGFRVRREVNGDINFYLRKRVGVKVLWHEIGPHGDTWTVEAARTRAAELLNEHKRAK